MASRFLSCRCQCYFKGVFRADVCSRHKDVLFPLPAVAQP